MAQRADGIEVLERAGVGFKLSLLLSAVGCEIFNGGVETHSIAKGISVLAIALKDAGRTLQDPDPICSAKAANAMREISHQTGAVFDELKSMLCRAQIPDTKASDADSLRAHFLRCFKKHRVTYLIAYMESLKFSLMVMGQIINLGRLMAARRYMENELATALIEQERAEIQNMLIIRCWSLNRLDRLYDLARREAEDGGVTFANDSMLDPALQKSQRNAFRKLRPISFGDVDTTLKQIKQTPKDMVKASADAIDPLLRLWVKRKQVSWDLSSRVQDGDFSKSPNDPLSNDSASKVEAGETEIQELYSHQAKILAQDLQQRYREHWATVETDPEDNEEEDNEPMSSNFADRSPSISPYAPPNTSNCFSIPINDSKIPPCHDVQGRDSFDSSRTAGYHITGNWDQKSSQPPPHHPKCVSDCDTYKILAQGQEGTAPPTPMTDTWKIPVYPMQGSSQRPHISSYPQYATTHFYGVPSQAGATHLPNRSYTHPLTSNSYHPSTNTHHSLRHSASYHGPSHPRVSRPTALDPSVHNVNPNYHRGRGSSNEEQYPDPSSDQKRSRDRIRSSERTRERRKQRSKARDKGYKDRARSSTRVALHGMLGAGAVTTFLHALESLSPGNWPLFLKC